MRPRRFGSLSAPRPLPGRHFSAPRDPRAPRAPAHPIRVGRPSRSRGARSPDPLPRPPLRPHTAVGRPKYVARSGARRAGPADSDIGPLRSFAPSAGREIPTDRVSRRRAVEPICSKRPEPPEMRPVCRPAARRWPAPRNEADPLARAAGPLPSPARSDSDAARTRARVGSWCPTDGFWRRRHRPGPGRRQRGLGTRKFPASGSIPEGLAPKIYL